MSKLKSGHMFGSKAASPQFGNVQAPLVQDGRAWQSAARGPTSHAEAYWPFYVGVGAPGLLFGFLTVFLIVSGAGRPVIGLVTLVFGLPFIFLGFLFVSIAATRALSSIRGGAETVGNVTLLTRTNAGFKVGAAIGFGLFLWFTPDVFGDPFTGNPSAKSAIIAQFLLKAIGFMGLFGMVFSRLERFARNRAGQNHVAQNGLETQQLHSRQYGTQADPVRKTQAAPSIPDGVRAVLADWPNRAALAMSVLAFVGQVIMELVSSQAPNLAGLILLGTFCFLAYVVLRLYFSVLDMVIRQMSGLYGFSIRAG